MYNNDIEIKEDNLIDDGGLTENKFERLKKFRETYIIVYDDVKHLKKARSMLFNKDIPQDLTIIEIYSRFINGRDV